MSLDLELGPNPTKSDVDRVIKSLRSTMEIPTISPVEQKVKKLARRVSKKLGYDVLLGKTGSGVLMRVIQGLEIEVIDRFAVYDYQLKFGLPMLNPHKSKTVASRAPTGFLVDAARGEDDLNTLTEEHTQMPSRWTRGDVWARTPIRHFPDEIPEFVLNKALQIKEALPEVAVYVEHLVAQPDPFLVVAYGCEEFYVEVWAEPGFEGWMTRDAQRKSGKSR